jgi:hypothetical protein
MGPQEPGDLTVCTGCQAVLVFQETPLGLTLDALTPEAVAEVEAMDPEAWGHVRQLRAEIRDDTWIQRMPGEARRSRRTEGRGI